MKQAWQPVASVARSTTPWSIGASSSEDDTSLMTPYRVRFSSRSPCSSESDVPGVSWSTAIGAVCAGRTCPAPVTGCSGPLCSTGVGGYTSPMTDAPPYDDAPQNDDDVRKIVKDRGIEFLFAQFVDMHGKPSAKLVPAHHLDDLLTEGAGFAGFAAGDIGQGPDDPDMIAMPDPSTLTILPWRPTVARFACDATVEGEEWPYCPRTILRHALARAADMGYEMKIGAELEYFLLRRADDGSLELADPLDTLDQPCYDM